MSTWGIGVGDNVHCRLGSDRARVPHRTEYTRRQWGEVRDQRWVDLARAYARRRRGNTNTVFVTASGQGLSLLARGDLSYTAK